MLIDGRGITLAERVAEITSPAVKLKSVAQRFCDCLGQCMVLVTLDTLLRWDRNLVRRKWTIQLPIMRLRCGFQPFRANFKRGWMYATTVTCLTSIRISQYLSC